ncbi:uncharacterized protein ACBR49_006264 [Aulostomus maculatus]
MNYSAPAGGSSAPGVDPARLRRQKRRRGAARAERRCAVIPDGSPAAGCDMTHFRGQIRGPHWGPAMDNQLIEFWRKHECLFNSALESYYDRNLKTRLWAEFASSIGKPVSDVERRSRSLRTQYGRVLWHPERVNTFQQRMLRDKLDFLRPYIVRRRGDSYLEDKFDDRDEDDEELETEGSIDQETRSVFGSPLEAEATGQDPDEEAQSGASTSHPAPLHAPNPAPQDTAVMSLSCDHHNEEAAPDHAAAAPHTLRHDILNQFAEVMLADMRQISDPLVLMRLRRDITDLVFKAVEEDAQRQRLRVLSVPQQGANAQLQGCCRPQPLYSQTCSSWRQRALKRRTRGSELGRRKQRWEEMRHMRRTSRSQLLPPIQQSQALEGRTESTSEALIQPSDIKSEMEPLLVKVEEDIV